MSKQLILALSKGRILDETLPLLADAGITPADVSLLAIAIDRGFKI